MLKDKKAEKIHGTRGPGKELVVGLLDRVTGKVHVAHMKNRKKRTLQVRGHLASGTELFTDELASYTALDKEDYVNQFANHAEGYVEGNVHTNGTFATLILTLALFAAPAWSWSLSSSQWFAPRFLGRVSGIMAQNEESGENEVSTGDIEKYVSVYKAMQRDRSLTVDKAAAAQGLTTEQFRQLESRVERDDAALQQARDELQAAAKSSPPSGQIPAPHP